MRLTNVGAALNRLRGCPTRCADPVWTKQGGGGRGGAPPPTIMAIASALPRLLMAAAAPAMTWLPLNVAIVDNAEVTARAHIACARFKSYRRVEPLGCMQGGSRCPGRAVEPERARWHDPVLGRWLGLTPERPALSSA